MTDIYKAARMALSELENAAMECADWGSYASEYFQQKHDLAGTIERIKNAAVTLRAALEQPAEPVAYMHVPSLAMDGKVRPVLSFEKYAGDYASGIYAERIPLYTTPQPAAWVGLSLDDCKDLCAGRINANDLTLIRAVEDSLREKNGGGV